MKHANLLITCAALFLFSSAYCSACEVAGPNKHVGSVVSIDSANKTFAIKDAETSKIIHFTAPENRLMILKVNDRVLVDYTDVDGTLTINSVESI